MECLVEWIVGVHVCVCAGDVLGASLLWLIDQMDDLYRGVYLFCDGVTSGDLLFPGVAEFFTLLHIPGTIFHPHTPNPQTDLFTDSLLVHINPFPTHAYPLLHTCTVHVCTCKQACSSTGEHKAPRYHMCEHKGCIYEHMKKHFLFFWPYNGCAVSVFPNSPLNKLTVCSGPQAIMMNYNRCYTFSNMETFWRQSTTTHKQFS